jgi:hypothetical protein
VTIEKTDPAGWVLDSRLFEAPATTGLGVMKKVLLVGVSLLAVAAASGARAEDYPGQNGSKKQAVCDPYKNYSCLDAYLGDNFFERFINYYKLEWGHDGPPVDPNAGPTRRANWPATPQTTPPYPFTEWPYGGTENMGVSTPNAADSPLMAALGNTALGKVMNDAHIQIYGWVDPGGNISTSGVRPGGNAPAAYDYTPNTFGLDQAVVYMERVPDTVQSDHVDWGFRLSAIYGENYRYTTSFGVASYQLLDHNLTNGYDFPMVYGELFFPQVMDGLLVRIGRYISIPDIEAQLAPNNYMYTHSMTYTFDNYTNEGVQTTLAVTKNWFFQLGLSIGTEAAPWHLGQTQQNPNLVCGASCALGMQMYPGNTVELDPGAIPSVSAAIRYQTDNGNDNIYIAMDGINGGTWGYNNLQWYGITWYHKFDEHWHFAWETYQIDQFRVLNENASVLATGTVLTPWSNLPFNSPTEAQCSSSVLWCTTHSIGSVMYINYRFSGLDTVSFRPEFFDDEEGQRTGIKTRYTDFGLGWQHWLSPQIEFRPELTYYHSINANAFNGNAVGDAFGANTVAPNKNFEWVAASDVIIHF